MAEYQQQNGRSPRQYVEEAMSERVVRTCNKCSLRFVKSEGCTEMTCRCGNKQCYVCGKDIGYPRMAAGRCAVECLQDPNLDFDAAMSKRYVINRIREIRPDLREEDLTPKVPNLPPLQPGWPAGLPNPADFVEPPLRPTGYTQLPPPPPPPPGWASPMAPSASYPPYPPYPSFPSYNPSVGAYPPPPQAYPLQCGGYMPTSQYIPMGSYPSYGWGPGPSTSSWSTKSSWG